MVVVVWLLLYGCGCVCGFCFVVVVVCSGNFTGFCVFFVYSVVVMVIVVAIIVVFFEIFILVVAVVGHGALLLKEVLEIIKVAILIVILMVIHVLVKNGALVVGWFDVKTFFNEWGFYKFYQGLPKSHIKVFLCLISKLRPFFLRLNY